MPSLKKVAVLVDYFKILLKVKNFRNAPERINPWQESALYATKSQL